MAEDHDGVPVFLAGAQQYDVAALQATIAAGLAAVGFDLSSLRGRKVLLKPNLVEPRREAPHMTTHPAVIVAVAEVFRQHGAAVRVGEAPGHVSHGAFRYRHRHAWRWRRAPQVLQPDVPG